MALVKVHRVTVLLLLLALFGLLVFSVRLKSPTLDEQNHVARGLAYLKTGDLRLSQEHPPGVNVWAAWPLLFDASVRLPLESPSWANAEWYGFADLLFWRTNDRPQGMIFAARVPVMLLTLVLAALVYRWGRALGGVWAGLIALVLIVFDPNILAHGRLATTDMGVTCLAVAAMWRLWRALREPGWGRWAWAGAALGAAQLSKFSALALVPVTVLIAVLAWARQCIARRSFRGAELGRWLGYLAVCSAVGGAVVWLGYGLRWGAIALVNGLPGPAPAYWSGVETILRRTGAGNPAFLMGQYSQEGWWYYFPVAFALKTPLPTLIVLVLAAGLWIWHLFSRPRVGAELPSGGRADRQADRWWGCLGGPALAFWALAMLSSFNIGYRHILPALPFLYLLAGWRAGIWVGRLPRVGHGLGAAGRRRPKIWGTGRGTGSAWVARAVVVVLCMWLAGTVVWIAPHYLAFFNVFAGGPDGGYRFLVDSNLDWGQDLPGLQRYAVAQDLGRIYLSWFGAAHPEAYDLEFHPLPGFWRFRDEPAAYGFNPYAPAPGTYAISASNLQGVALADHDLYAWFRERAPVARIGHSVYVYQVQREAENGTAAVLGVPMRTLADSERTLLARGASVRQYDPTTGIILPAALKAERIWFVAPTLPEGAAVVREGSGYHVFQVSTAAWPSSDMGVRFGPFVRMLDYQHDDVSLSTQQELLLRVRWRVERSPHHDAVGFAHLLDGTGRYVTGWDGITAPSTCWQRGDLIDQDYRIPLSTDLRPGTYSLEIGWYDAETLERWPCYVDEQDAGNRFVLEGIIIKP